MNRYVEIHKSLEAKPAMDAPCNNCGWCCLTETCDLGILFSGPDDTVCSQLVAQNGKYFCKLANTKSYAAHLHIGEGCNAISVKEKLAMVQRILA